MNDSDYIYKYVNSIYHSLGIKEPINHHMLIYLLKKKNDEKFFSEILNYFNLPVKINITYSNNFKTKSISNNSGYIMAQVQVNEHIPLFGSKELNDFPINIQMPTYGIYNINTLIMIISHEISHILLYSLRHPEKNNEIFTDITAMMLGFYKIFKKGKEETISEDHFFYITEKKTTYGYLNNEMLDQAIIKIKNILKEHREKISKLSILKKKADTLYDKYKKKYNKFNILFQKLSKKPPTKININDLKNIQKLYVPGYIKSIRYNKDKIELEKINSFINKYKPHYTEEKLKLAIHNYNILSDMIKNIKNHLQDIKLNIKLLKKYI